MENVPQGKFFFGTLTFTKWKDHRRNPHILVKVIVHRTDFLPLSGIVLYGPRQANLVLIAYASGEGSA